MLKMIRLIMCITLLLPLVGFASQASMQVIPSKATTAAKQESITPQRALELLQQGNQRFLSDQLRSYNYAKEMKMTVKKGQHPLAVILSCIDSRSIADILFDQGLGNVFVARVAGNVINKDMLGSMEFATKHAGAHLIVVMGHTECGAIQGACVGGAVGNLKDIFASIQPAVTFVKKAEGQDFNCESSTTVNAIAKQNVLNQMQNVLNGSSVIKALVANKDVEIVGAMHNLKTGKVEFFNIDGKVIS